MFRSSRHVGPLVVATACWGLGAVASKRAVAEIPPLVLLVIQLIASLAALATIALFAQSTLVPLANRWRLGMLGVLNPGLAYMFSLAGLVTISADMSVLLWALEPLLIVALARLLLGDRVGVRTMLLAGLAVLGAGLAGAAGTSGADPRGVALTIAGVGCCAVYTVRTTRYLDDTSTLPVVLIQQLSTLVFAAIALVAQWQASGIHGLESVTTMAWMTAVVSGILYYDLAFWAFLSGLRRTRASTAAVFLSLIPLFGITGGWLLLDERMTPLQTLGATLAILAVSGVSRDTARAPIPTVL